MFSKKSLISFLERKYTKNSKFYQEQHPFLYQEKIKYIEKNPTDKNIKIDIFKDIRIKKDAPRS